MRASGYTIMRAAVEALWERLPIRLWGFQVRFPDYNIRPHYALAEHSRAS